MRTNLFSLTTEEEERGYGGFSPLTAINRWREGRLAQYTAKPDPRSAILMRELGLAGTESAIAKVKALLVELDAAGGKQ